jgi:hypothetical protein
MEDEAAQARAQREAAMTSAERMMRGGKKKKKKINKKEVLFPKEEGQSP